MEPSELEKDIVDVLKGLYGESRLKYFKLISLPNVTIIKIDPNMYPADSEMHEYLQYIHIVYNGGVSAQLFNLNMDTGEKEPVSSKIYGGLYEALKPMKLTILTDVPSN